MNKSIIAIALISIGITGCAGNNTANNGDLPVKSQQKINKSGEHFGDTAVPAYIALFPEHLDSKYINNDKTLNSQAVISDFSKNWNTYYNGQAEFINVILNVNQENNKEYRNIAKAEVKDLKLDENISQDVIYKSCAGNQFVQQSSEQRLSFYQCVFLNQMLNADRKIMVYQVYQVSDVEKQKIIDQTRDLAATSYLEMIKNSFNTNKWYSSTPVYPHTKYTHGRDLIIR